MCTALLAGLAVCWPDAARGATIEEWRRDLDAIVSDVLAIHPDPFGKTGELTWRRQAEELKESIPRLAEPQRVVRLMQLIALLGDGHTSIELEDEKYALWYPLRIHEFTDGYFVTSAHRSVAELAGAQVLELAGRPATEVIDSARSVFGADNAFDRKQRLYAVSNAYLMQGLGHADSRGRLAAKFRLKNGRIVERELSPKPTDAGFYPPGVPAFEWIFPPEVYGMPFDSADDWIAAYRDVPSAAFQEIDTTRPPFLQQRSLYTRRAMPEQDAYYIQINQTDDGGMVGFMGESLQEVDRLKPKRLIVDMRFNFGGDGSTVRPMIHHFIRRENDPPWQELYLVTGRKSFSAALAAIDAFIDHTDATLIGEPAGAPLNFFGDTVARPYPALGLSLEVSALKHQLGDYDDLRAFVPVDVPAPMSFADYVAGRDPAIDPILAGEEMRSIPLIALQDGGEAARRVHLARQERFRDIDWYRPPTEISLRFVVFELIEQQRFEHALEAARLNTEIHPFTWNTWYNLGNAQHAAGSPQREQRFGSYACVVALAPTNWNVPSILQLFRKNNIDPQPAPDCPVAD